MTDQAFTMDELANAEWTFGDQPVAAPENYDPDARGSVAPPAGWHRMVLLGGSYTRVVPEHVFKYKGAQCVLPQLRPVFRVADGQPYAGATVMDFLPMPGPDMLPELANRWGHFFKRVMGRDFELPPGVLVPAGFKIASMANREIDVCVVPDLDANGVQKLDRDGLPQMQVKFFGYGYAGEFSGAAVTPGATAPTTTAPGTSPKRSLPPTAGAPLPAPGTPTPAPQYQL